MAIERNRKFPDIPYLDSELSYIAKHSGKGEKGDKGDPGEPGPQGIPGAPGVGVPTGGTTGQVLKKLSNTDYDTGWSINNLQGYTVATLPAGVQGDIAFVTDALNPTYLGTITGGGTTITPVFFDGTNWVAF